MLGWECGVRGDWVYFVCSIYPIEVIMQCSNILIFFLLLIKVESFLQSLLFALRFFLCFGCLLLVLTL